MLSARFMLAPAHAFSLPRGGSALQKCFMGMFELLVEELEHE